jgi:hypothetical protein
MRNPLTNTELNTRLGTTDTKIDTVDDKLDQRIRLKYVSLSLSAATGTDDIAVATDGDIYIEDVSIYSLTNASDLTSVSIQTADAVPFVVMSAVEGGVANLTSGTNIKPANAQKSFYLVSGTKLQYTVDGTGDWSAYILIKYRSISGGTLESAK